jgi:hypothetical protein
MTWRRLFAVLALGGLTGLPAVVTAQPAGAFVAGTPTPYFCSISLPGQTETFYAPGTVSAATMQNSYKKGQIAKLSDLQLSLPIPQSIVQQWDALGLDWIAGSISTFRIQDPNAQTSIVNVAGDGIGIVRHPLPNPARGVTLTAPGSPTTGGSWKVAKTGTMNFYDGNIVALLSSNKPVNFKLFCRPDPSEVIASAPVS